MAGCITLYYSYPIFTILSNSGNSSANDCLFNRLIQNRYRNDY